MVRTIAGICGREGKNIIFIWHPSAGLEYFFGHHRSRDIPPLFYRKKNKNQKKRGHKPHPRASFTFLNFSLILPAVSPGLAWASQGYCTPEQHQWQVRVHVGSHSWVNLSTECPKGAAPSSVDNNWSPSGPSSKRSSAANSVEK